MFARIALFAVGLLLSAAAYAQQTPPRATSHGKVLDDQYMQVMVQDHNKTVKLFQQEERSGNNTQLKSFAAKALPILKEHQTMATETARKAKQQASVR